MKIMNNLKIKNFEDFQISNFQNKLGGNYQKWEWKKDQREAE